MAIYKNIGGVATLFADVGGGVRDYDDLTDRPAINGTTLSGALTLHQLGLKYESTEVLNEVIVFSQGPFASQVLMSAWLRCWGAISQLELKFRVTSAVTLAAHNENISVIFERSTTKNAALYPKAMLGGFLSAYNTGVIYNVYPSFIGNGFGFTNSSNTEIVISPNIITIMSFSFISEAADII